MASGRAWQKFLEKLTSDEYTALTDYVGGDVISPNELLHYQKNDPLDSLVRREQHRLALMDSLFRKAPQPRKGLEVYRGADSDFFKPGPYDYYLPTSKNEAVAGMFGPVKKIKTTPRVRYLDINRILPNYEYQDPNFTVGGSEQEFLLPRGGVLSQLGDDEWLYDYLKEYSEGGYVG